REKLSIQKTLKNLLPGSDVKALLGSLERIATALEVIVEQQYHIALRPNLKQGKDESEVMESDDKVYAQQEVDDLMKGRPEEED
ncbi:hypothetical protein LCGC14_2613830, partial [marine sediment metagenome]